MDKTLKKYHLMNNALGWLIGIIACVVYIMTAEATASWWDCGEYTATAVKLQVGHPPGAPTFQVFGRLFSMFTTPENAAFAVNVMSAMASGLGIMFLFWTITLLGKKLLKTEELALNNSKVWAVFASGVVGALAYTFSDTYWFSAVESEVYAMSSFFTAVVFWAILKWEEQADDPHSLRWLVLVCFLVGIAIGVHLLNLLTIPAIVYVVYFKKFQQSTKGFILSGVISLFILAVILWGIIPGIVNLSCDFDVFFVNKLHMGFNTGTVVFFLLVAVFVLWGLWNNSHLKRPGKTVNIIVLAVVFLLLVVAKVGAQNASVGFFFVLCLLGVASYYIIKSKNRQVINAALLGFTLLVIGYSTFFILVIRANTNTPLNENAPKDAVAMRAYLGREQYGETPFLTGPYYTAGNPIASENDYAKYVRTTDYLGRDYYKVGAYAQKYTYDKSHTGFFPRMYSPDEGRKHPTYYKYWAGEPPMGGKPTFAQNMTFFHRYQMGWMYWRYFMWNFAGRQNDIQGHHFDDNVFEYADAAGNRQRKHEASVNYTDGNWISGIDFVDEHRLGPQENLPDDLANNKARNKYYMLPLLLGMLGLIYHCIKNRKDAFVVFLMFFMTGLAIAIYLNMPPCQPRERDYAFVGSFYFFAVWIGLGVYALYDWLSTQFEKKERNNYLIAGAACLVMGFLFNGAWFILAMIGAALIVVSVVRLPRSVALPLAFVLTMSVPVIMGAENWDDHDRSQKTAARDFARNYLNSMNKNGVLITFGDNDTFPLWYAQEVEECRTDVRILNYTLSGMHWYVEQLYNKLYESDALPFTFPKEMYGLGHEIFVLDPNGQRMEVTEALKTVLANRDRYVRKDNRSDSIIYLPTNKFQITLDKQKLVANGIIDAAQADTIPNVIAFDVNVSRGYLMRNEMMMLDFLGTNRFERTVCIMNVSYIANVFPVVDHYSIDDGMLSMLVPYPVTGGGLFHYTERTKDYFLKGVRQEDGSYEPLRWGNLNKDIYVDPVSENMAVVQRQTFTMLAYQQVTKGDTATAKQLMEQSRTFFPQKNFPSNRFSMTALYLYAMIGDEVNAYETMCNIFKYYHQRLVYAKQFQGDKAMGMRRMMDDCYNTLYQLLQCRQRMAFYNPFTGRDEGLRLTEAGEKAFIAAGKDNAARLKEIDNFIASPAYQEVMMALASRR
ncbi:MAG: DUF2723 domain-containing protein [Bacteroidales bacterium]|nr:DUF2723 domain-containing protein [Bacteroidales bacterium]